MKENKRKEEVHDIPRSDSGSPWVEDPRWRDERGGERKGEGCWRN